MASETIAAQIPAVKTLYRYRPTGRTRKIEWEFGPVLTLPEVELVSTNPECSEYESYDGVSSVEGDTRPLGKAQVPVAYYTVQPDYLYDVADEGQLATVLVREQWSVDAGDNEIRRRVAPQTILGISAPLPGYGSGSLVVIHGDPIYAVKP